MRRLQPRGLSSSTPATYMAQIRKFVAGVNIPIRYLHTEFRTPLKKTLIDFFKPFANDFWFSPPIILPFLKTRIHSSMAKSWSPRIDMPHLDGKIAVVTGAKYVVFASLHIHFVLTCSAVLVLVSTQSKVSPLGAPRCTLQQGLSQKQLRPRKGCYLKTLGYLPINSSG